MILVGFIVNFIFLIIHMFVSDNVGIIEDRYIKNLFPSPFTGYYIFFCAALIFIPYFGIGLLFIDKLFKL